MNVQPNAMTPDDTREKLLIAALNQFAERGFYGASIAQIAGEVGLTKQALLYHFRRKEDLYSEVLKRISERMQSAMPPQADPGASAEQRLEAMFAKFYAVALDHPLDSKVLMRELIDDQRRDSPEDEWHFRAMLNRMVAALDAIDGMPALPFAEKLARIYSIVSMIQYFVGSGAVLKRFYGDGDFAEIRSAYPEQLRSHVRRLMTP